MEGEMPPDISEIIRTRFGCHRGYGFDRHEQNSLGAIRVAVERDPVFVEFDVIYHDHEPKTGHPPQRPLDPLDTVLESFRRSKTYPKVDLKLNGDETDHVFIDKVRALISDKELSRALVTMGNGAEKSMSGERYVHMYRFLFDELKDDTPIRLSFDLGKMKKYRSEPFDKKFRSDLRYLAPKIDSLCLEIHEEDWEESARIAEDHGIPHVTFWLRSWPSVHNPRVETRTLLEALELERRYCITVMFDIDPGYVV